MRAAGMSGIGGQSSPWGFGQEDTLCRTILFFPGC